jgi:hypothetical protein
MLIEIDPQILLTSHLDNPILAWHWLARVEQPEWKGVTHGRTTRVGLRQP